MRLNGLRRPPMPPNPAPFITDTLVQMGIVVAAGMGAAPLTWTEIDAWCRRNVDLPSWQLLLIREMSVKYLAAKSAGESENCPPPWLAPSTSETRAAEAAFLDSVLG